MTDKCHELRALVGWGVGRALQKMWRFKKNR